LVSEKKLIVAKEVFAATFRGALLEAFLNFQIQSNATEFTGFTEDLCASSKIRMRPYDFLPYRPIFFIFPELQNQLYSCEAQK